MRALEGRKVAAYSAALALLGLAAAGILSVGSATANQCAAQCYAAEKACLVATKGDPSCRAQLSACLQSCRARR
jgi:hypothetical protein